MNRILRGSIPRRATVFWFGLLTVIALAGEDAASILRKLNELRKAPDPAALDVAWSHLDSPEASVREAARQVVQAQPFEKWKDRALEEKSTWASLELLRALVEACPRSQMATFSPHVCEQITTLRLEQMEKTQLLAAIRVTRLVVERLGPLSEDELQQMRDLWTHLPPPADSASVKERQGLLEFLRMARPR